MAKWPEPAWIVFNSSSPFFPLVIQTRTAEAQLKTHVVVFSFFVQFYFILSNVSAMHCEQNLFGSGNFKNMFIIFYSPIQHCCTLTIRVCVSPSKLLDVGKKPALFGFFFVHNAAQQTTVPQWHLISCQFCWQRPYSLVRYIGFLSSCGALKCTLSCFWRKDQME